MDIHVQYTHAHKHIYVYIFKSIQTSQTHENRLLLVDHQSARSRSVDASFMSGVLHRGGCDLAQNVCKLLIRIHYLHLITICATFFNIYVHSADRSASFHRFFRHRRWIGPQILQRLLLEVLIRRKVSSLIFLNPRLSGFWFTSLLKWCKLNASECNAVLRYLRGPFEGSGSAAA